MSMSMSTSTHTTPTTPMSTSSRTGIIVASIILGVIILGGIAAIIYFATAKPSSSSSSSSSNDGDNDNGGDSDGNTTQADLTLRIGDTVYLGGELESGGIVWLHMGINVNSSVTNMVTDISNATPIQLVANPELTSNYPVSEGDAIMYQSYGLNSDGEAIPKVALKMVSGNDVYLADYGISTFCAYRGTDQENEAKVSGFALIPPDSSNNDYQHKSPPSDSNSVLNDTIGSSYPEMGYVMDQDRFWTRPSYHGTSSTNLCGGHPMMILDQSSNMTLGFIDGGTSTEFFFQRI